MSSTTIHAAEPPCIGEPPPSLREASPVCQGRLAHRDPRTYRFGLVTCKACRRIVCARPQLFAAMRRALQAELPLDAE